ncbi:helix-turn-helix transcriptional regulator [Litoreibacter roseus]|uniref:HTH luxR-type domain-containing protein n=1 Tax=Litoreibacter roseus TaxID=2601869 RepID=A0A6N6JMB4_9RHOB|nr:autoinducer binding domain-containing protein [Litoreibacter roseus]GFE67284.1 hypothetical protein KIN_43580 [Litoreibacter roseus]
MLETQDIRHLDLPDVETGLQEIDAVARSGFFLAFNMSTLGADFATTTFPERWQNLYMAKNYASSDPLMIWALGNDGRKRWSDVTFPDLDNVLRTAREHGLVYGGILAATINGHKSILSVARPDRQLHDHEIGRLDKIFRAWSTALFEVPAITEKETIVLKHLSEGHSIEDVAAQIQLSVPAVKKRIESARRRLQVRTTIEAVALAIRRGYI